LGFSEKQATTIVKYRASGVVFKYKEDFKKIFVVSDEMYLHLEPFITLPIKDVESAIATIVAEEPMMIELNNTDSVELRKIKSISGYLAKRIIDYRKKLGGFYTVKQLLDINGINEELYANISPYFTVDAGRVKKMDLNSTPFKEFVKHPYFEYYVVKSIFEYKDKHNIISSVEEIKNIPLIYNDLYSKLSPYLYTGNI
jgi:DNA uptake protein ComE-like DNA-binding protein